MTSRAGGGRLALASSERAAGEDTSCGWPARPSPVAIALGAAFVALVLGGVQLARPHVLAGELGYNLGYDDGVYFGVATRLVNGVLPYRDYAFVHPPGIAYLLSPIALVGRAIGTHGALAAARCLTVLVVAANAALAGLVVRPLGRVAVLVAAGALALWPLTVAVDRTVELEPYLVLFCLLGAVLMFRGTDLAPPRRLMLAGVAFGFAVDVKVWAVLAVAAAFVLTVPRWRRATLPLAAGVLIGGLVPSLPFLILAPHAFVHDVITAQLSRGGTFAPTPLSGRAALLTGLVGLVRSVPSVDLAAPSALPSLHAPGWLGEALLLVLAVAVLWAFGPRTWRMWRRRSRPEVGAESGESADPPSRLEWFTAVAYAVVFAGMFASANFYDHYAYFPAAFLAPLLGVIAVRAWAAGRGIVTRRGRPGRSGRHRRLAVIATAAGVAVAGLLIAQEISYSGSYLGEASDPAAPLATAIPSGACVLSDFPTDLLLANRYTPARSCPAVVDPYGLFLTDDHGSEPHPNGPYRPAFEAEWLRWLQQADYVELRIPFSDFIPWSPAAIRWFNTGYRLVAHVHTTYARPFIDSAKDSYVYKRVASPRLPSAGTPGGPLQRGLAALAARQLTAAVADFRAAALADPHNPEAFYDLGVGYQQEGDAASAAGAYEHALRLNPADRPALFNLAILDSGPHPAAAAALYRRLLAINPNDPNVNFNLGLLLIHDGQPAAGHRYLRKALREAPSLAQRLPPGTRP